MTFNFDTSKLSQAAGRKATPHDNCIVLDLGTGTFPRDIEVRLPDDDGARQIAIWDGSLNLSVDDEVFCNEYAGNPKWRIASMGGTDSGAGKQRVNEVWALDFTSVSLVTDASDNVTLNTGTLTLPSDIIHLGDPDNKISFTDDVQTFTVGGKVLLTLTEAGQDVVEIGDGSDVDINFNDDGFFEGSSGRLGIGTTAPQTPLQVGNGAPTINPGANNVIMAGPDTFSGRFYIEGTGQADFLLVDGGAGADVKASQLVNISGITRFKSLTDAGGNKVDNIVVMDHATGNVGVGASSPGSLMEWNMATEDLEFVDAGSAAATEQDWVEVNIGGVQGFIHVFAAK